MTYTAVFQNTAGKYTFVTFVSTHDRQQAWSVAHESRIDPDSCLVLLIDGEASVKTFDDVVDMPW